jgi:glycosyltransferase involved in cell wall biosynthesis
VGRLTEQKGHFVLLHAARILACEGIPLEIVCVGDGDFRPRLEAYIHRHHLQEHVRLVGWQTEAQVRQWLESSRAMVMPSLAEGLPVGIMEALALGRPVISTFIAGIPELILPPTNGWLVPAGDPERLADAIRTALTTDVATLTEMGRQGQLRVRQRHDAAMEAKKLAQAMTGDAMGGWG